MTGRAQRIEARCRKYQAVKHDMTGRGCEEQTAPHGAWRLTVSRKSADDPAGRSEWRRKCAAARAVRRECAAARAAPCFPCAKLSRAGCLFRYFCHLTQKLRFCRIFVDKTCPLCYNHRKKCDDDIKHSRQTFQRVVGRCETARIRVCCLLSEQDPRK